MIPFHGQRVSKRLFQGMREETEDEVRRGKLPIIRITRREWCDIQLMAQGALSPLIGFMGKEDFETCIKDMHLSDGTLWSIPITLSASEPPKKDEVALEYEGKIWSKVIVSDVFRPDKEKEAEMVYGTTDLAHPSIAYLKSIGNWYVGGEVFVLELSDFGPKFKTCEETREEFKKQGWSRVVGFQTRNPPHRGHEYIQKCALEICDGLFINPLVGETKKGDIPPAVIMQTYSVLVDKYYPNDRVLLVPLPASMRYGGPKEAIHHAIMRKNYGCTHFIVGRDHAGVGNFYGPFDAQKIFDRIKPEELEIIPLFFDTADWCDICKNIGSDKTCPHERLSISGTQIRKMLSESKVPPPEFMRPEVAQILIKYYESN